MADLPAILRASAEPFGEIDDADLQPLLDRIGDSRVVLLGEASHGTSEFYRMRQAITRALITEKGFDLVAAEADWPDAERVDRWVRDLPGAPDATWRAFERFPTWMWRNREVLDFVEWLREHNRSLADPLAGVGFFGLDLYSLYTSIQQVLEYLEDTDPDLATMARERYGCLAPFEADPALYGRAVLSRRYRECEDEAVAVLEELLARRLDLLGEADDGSDDGRSFLDAVQNAKVVADAERYYRVMYYGAPESWNLRDTHMFETLEALLDFRGPDSRAVVWAHNSHIGDAGATEMRRRGEINIGHLCRRAFGDDAYLVGFGTHTGTVAAASSWGGPLEIKDVRPSHEASYERLGHDSGLERALIPLRAGQTHSEELREELSLQRLERAIGVIYRPETELQSHYFRARLPDQFDEWIWFDESTAVTPLGDDDRAPAGRAEPHPLLVD